ncbi:MAG: HAD family hydrolase, partial [Enterococcus sp.]|nr:HAD family hydrolase [Enterococcus sp.]
DITHDFDTILTGEEVDSAKPDPEIYLTLMRKFDVKPNETLIFEDSEPGLEAARASDACYIKVNTHFFC